MDYLKVISISNTVLPIHWAGPAQNVRQTQKLAPIRIERKLKCRTGPENFTTWARIGPERRKIFKSQIELGSTKFSSLLRSFLMRR